MDKNQTAHPITYRPLQFSLPCALFIYMLLLLHVTFGGAVASVVWWLVLVLPVSAALAQFATRRILWSQLAFIVAAAALTLASWLLIAWAAAAIAPNADYVVAALAFLVIVVGLWAYQWAKKHVSMGKNGLVTRINGRPRPAEAQIVVPRRGCSIHNASLFVKVLTFSAIVSGAVKLMSLEGKTAMLGVSALIFACGGALAVGHTLHVLMLTRAWERKHDAPLLVDTKS